MAILFERFTDSALFHYWCFSEIEMDLNFYWLNCLKDYSFYQTCLIIEVQGYNKTRYMSYIKKKKFFFMICQF